jgi:hypothetical protein
MRSRIRTQGLMAENGKILQMKKIYLKKNAIFSEASVKDVQATGEAFSTQKRTSSTLKHAISSLMPIFMGNL